MELVGTEANPIPPDPVAGYVVGPDGLRLRFARWRPTAGRRRGTVCLLQGRAECIEKYFEVVGELRARGFAVAALDWRGQGGSDRLLADRRRGHVEDFSDYDADLDLFLRDVVLPDCPPPYYALAHSSGALIALRAARTGRTRFERMVLVAPFLDLGRTPVPHWLVRLSASVATAVGFGETRLPGQEACAQDRMPFVGNLLTSDPLRYGRTAGLLAAAPALALGAPTFGWLYAAKRAMTLAAEPEFAPSVQVPVLLVAAGHDKIVSNAAIAALARELRAGAYVIVPGARHEVLMERTPLREQFWAAFDAFVPGSAVSD